MQLFHVRGGGAVTSMRPRPSPPGTPYEGRPWVWAVDEAHLPNYLLPRDCPRVCWRTLPGHSLLGSTAARVVAVESAWGDALTSAALTVHTLDPDGFTMLDRSAGYWVCEREVRVTAVRRVDDCRAAIAEHDVELRVVPSLWPYLDAVTTHVEEFSAIRMRNVAELPGRGTV